MFEKWITDNSGCPFYARKEFNIEKEIKSATAALCGLGQFVFYLNGQKVGDHELDPGWTDYNKYVQYVTFDVHKYLKQGKNAVGAEVGNGWYKMMNEHYSFHFPPFMPPNPNPYVPFGNCLLLAVKMIINYMDGSVEEIIADETWKVGEHPVIMTNIFGSETIDGRKRKDGWQQASYDDSTWADAVIADAPKGSPELQTQPPVKVIKSYEGKYLHTVDGRAIYDFGQNISGMLEFQVKGKAGDEIRFYAAEKLDANGDVDQMAKGWVMIDNCVTYIIGKDDVWETYRMQFTYFAGRYFAVEGNVRALMGHAITSAHKKSGSFACDDQRYEQIYDIVEKAVEANMLSVHTDCPTIERFAWQEPNHLMAPSIMFMKDGESLWKKFFKDMRAAQHTGGDWFNDMGGGKFYPGDGLVPSQAPCYIPNVLPVPGMGSFYDIIPWGSSCILGVYWHYMFYGDKKVIEDNYDTGIRYLNHLKTKITPDGFIHHGLGDWGNPAGEFARDNIETVFLYADAKTLAYFADILGKADAAEEINAFAASVRKNYNDKLLVYNDKSHCWCYRVWDKDEIVMTQAVEALPLYWGLVPEDKAADVALALRKVLERDQTFKCGEVGQPYVISTASKYGMNDLISRFILKESHPSYYAFVLAGETTLGEYWEDNPRSHCHDMMGHIIEWYYTGIAGIHMIEPGFEKIVIQPYLPETMTWFKCSYASIKGNIVIEVHKKDDQICVQLTIPNNVDYEFDDTLLALSGKCVIIQ